VRPGDREYGVGNHRLHSTNAVKAKGGRVALEQVPTGGHYESMIDKGIPAGIRFIGP